MEQSQFPQVIQQAPQSSFYTKETDDLLKKYLKMQIAAFYWGVVSRVIFYILIVISIVTTAYTLGPILESLLGPISTYQDLLQGKTSLPVQQNNSQGIDINAILQQLQDSDSSATQ